MINKLRISFPVVLAALLIIFNIIFLTLPLIGVLGYENSVANSFLLFIIGGLFIVYFLRKRSGIPPDYLFFLKEEWKFLVLFLLLPFVVAVIPSMMLSTCPLCDGIKFYLVLVIPALFLGTSAGFFSYFISRKFGYVNLIVCVLILIFISILEFYYHPQVYFYSPLIGFTPGTIYDEELNVNLSILVYRVLNAAGSAALIILVSVLGPKIKRPRLTAIILVILTLCLSYYLKPVFGYSTDTDRLEKKLYSSIETQHFDINYSQPENHFSTPPIIALLHEYNLERAEDDLKLNVKYKIRSYLFKNSVQKKELFGAGNADVAKPWQHQIFLNYNSYGISLRHELIHVLTSDFGVTPLKVADGFNNAMIEGFAMAVDNNFDGYPVHYAVKLAREAGYNIEIKNLFSGFNFFSQYATLSYIYAGSFIRFLIDRYGIFKIEQLYGDLDFQKVIGKNITELGNEYFAFIDSMRIDFNKYKAQLYFAGLPIFKKFCPRTAASQIKEANELYTQKKYKEALKIYSEVFGYSNSYESLSGNINSLIKLDRFKEAELIIHGNIDKFRESRYIFNLRLMLADVYVRDGEISQAKIIYDSLLIQAPHINYVNNVLTKEEFLKKGIDTLKKYLDADPEQKYEMISGLNKNTIYYFSIPEMLDLCADTTQLRIVCGMFKSAKADDFISSYALLKLSQAGIYLYDYKSAKQFALESLNYKNDNYFSYTLSENLRKINWLINYSDELKPYFVYK